MIAPQSLPVTFARVEGRVFIAQGPSFFGLEQVGRPSGRGKITIALENPRRPSVLWDIYPQKALKNSCRYVCDDPGVGGRKW